MRIKKTKLGYKVETQMFAFEKTMKPVNQIVASSSNNGKIVAFNVGGKTVYFYDYRPEARKPGR